MKTILQHSTSGIVRFATCALAALSLSAASVFAVPTVKLSIAGQDFGNGNTISATSGGTHIGASKSYSYNLAGTCQGTGTLASLVPAGTPIATFVNGLVAGAGSKLKGTVANPTGTLATDVTLVNRTISGTKTIPNFGSVYISLKIVGIIKTTGEVTLNVSNVKVRTPNQSGAAVGGTIKFLTNSNLTVSVAPVIEFKALNQVGISENGGSKVITILRTQSGAGTVTVHYSMANGTAGNSDYTASSGTVSFAPNQVSKTISVPILDDGTHEAVEKFTITLSSPTGGAVLGAKSTTTVIINDND